MAEERAGCAGRRAVEEPVLSLPKEPLAFSVRQARRQKKLELLRLRAAHTPPTAFPPPPPVRRFAQDDRRMMGDFRPRSSTCLLFVLKSA